MFFYFWIALRWVFILFTLDYLWIQKHLILCLLSFVLRWLLIESLELTIIGFISTIFLGMRLFELDLWRAFFLWRVNISLRWIVLIFCYTSHFVDRTWRFGTRRLSVLVNSFRAARIHYRSWNHIVDTVIFCVITTLNWLVICVRIICNYHFSAHWAQNWRCICCRAYFQGLYPKGACVFVSWGLIYSVALVQVLIVIKESW